MLKTETIRQTMRRSISHLEAKLERADQWLGHHRTAADPLAEYQKLRPAKRPNKKRYQQISRMTLRDLGVQPLFCIGCATWYYPKEPCDCS